MEVTNQITKWHPDFLPGPSLKGETDTCVPDLSTAESPQANLCFPKDGSRSYISKYQQDIHNLWRENTKIIKVRK